MALSDELLEQIGAYLSKQMTAVEKEQFELRMQQDTSLRDEVATQREIKQGLIFIAQKQRFKALHADLEKRGLLNAVNPPADQAPSNSGRVLPLPIKRTVFRSSWAYFAMAASVVLLLGIGWVVYRNQVVEQAQTSRYTQAFNTFFSTSLKPVPSTYPDPDRVGASLQNPLFSQDSARLQEAVMRLERHDIQLAINQLKPIAQAAPGHWSASAQWYLALAYLINRQPEQARQLMREIATVNGHPYRQEAQRFIRQVTPTNEAGN